MTRPRKDGLKRDKVRRVTKDERIASLEKRVNDLEGLAKEQRDAIGAFVNVLLTTGGLQETIEEAVGSAVDDLQIS